jgi:HK97 gp10 family phage protein
MIKATVRGIPDLKAALAGIVPKLRVRALRNALAAGARVVQREARAQRAQEPSAGRSMDYAVRKGYRRSGTVERAIAVRTSKLARRNGDVGVFVNVRPAKRGFRGGKNPGDPFYWRFLEFGTKNMGAKDFLQPAAQRLGDALQVFIRTIGPQIAKLNKPKAPAP